MLVPNNQFFSFSLGCKAIFLLGGKSREDPPLAMFLRSGDVVLMAGEARECFHGSEKHTASVMHSSLLVVNIGIFFFIQDPYVSLLLFL